MIKKILLSTLLACSAWAGPKMIVTTNGVSLFDDYNPFPSQPIPVQSDSEILAITTAGMELDISSLEINDELWEKGTVLNATSEGCSPDVTGTYVSRRSSFVSAGDASFNGEYLESQQSENHWEMFGATGYLSQSPYITKTGTNDWRIITKVFTIRSGSFGEYAPINGWDEGGIFTNTEVHTSFFMLEDESHFVGAYSNDTYAIFDKSDYTPLFECPEVYGTYTPIGASTGTVSVVYVPVHVPAPSVYEPTIYYPTNFSQGFNPPVGGAVVSDSPLIAEWTRQNKNGDTLALTGESLSTNFAFYGAGLEPTNGTLQLLDGRQAAVTVPSVLPTNDVYIMWAKSGEKKSNAAMINAAEAWWVGPDTVATGETFSVYGRNLELGGDGLTQLYINGYGWVTNTAANPYKVDFVCPEMTNGTYTIYAHNGHGGKYGWSEALSLTVRTETDWSAGTTYTVTDGAGDDLSNIQTAITSCTDGDTVYFANGTYEISASLTCSKDNIRFLGQSTNAIITSHSTFGTDTLVSMPNRTNLRFETLTFDSGTNMTDVFPFIEMSATTDIEFDGVFFTAENHPTYTWSSANFIDFETGSKRISFSNCKFELPSQVNIAWSEQIFFDNCDFYGINDCWIFVNAGKSIGVSVVDCTFQDYSNVDINSAHTRSVGRLYHANGTGGKNANVYFGGNVATDICPREGYYDQNGQGEQYLLDLSTTQFRGLAASANSNTVTFASALPASSDRFVVAIVDGKGMGQFRDIEAYGGNTLTNAINWRVVPDETSLCLIGSYFARHAVYGNRFDGTARSIQDETTKSIGVHIFGSGVDLCVENNVMTDLRRGIDVTKLQNSLGADYVDRPFFFNYYASNHVSNVRDGLVTEINTAGGISTYNDRSFLGNVYKRNEIAGSIVHAIWHRARYESIDGTDIDLHVYQENEMSDWGTYLVDDDDTYQPDLINFVWKDNTTNGAAWNP